MPQGRFLAIDDCADDGGERGLIDAYMPLLQALASKIIYTGALGSGKSVKMIKQFLNAAISA